MKQAILLNRPIFLCILLAIGGTWQVKSQGRQQTPKPPYPYQEEFVKITNPADGVELGGTLTIPARAGSHPLICLIPGASPFDRDQKLGPHQSFKLWADYLTRAGFATFRMDDRGTGESKGNKMIANYELLSSDILAAIEELKSHPKIDSGWIGLLGHSQGASLAVLAANRSKEIRSLVLLGSSGRSLLDNMAFQEASKSTGNEEINLKISKYIEWLLLKNQEHSNESFNLDKEVTAFIDQLSEQDKSLATLYYAQIKAFVNMFSAVPMGMDALTFNQIPLLEQTTIPVLAITGSHDPLEINLPAIEAALRKAHNPKFSVLEMDSLNHMLQHCDSPDDGNPASWVANEETVNPEVLKKVADWMGSLKQRPF